MRGRVITWYAGMPSLGRVALAIGVFDGVHLGHQQLVRACAAAAEQLDARPVALTFDRDPDQVVTPGTAAPQLLTLADKCRFLLACGADTVLVVPFTPELAETDAAEFLDEVVGSCCEVAAVHVGHDFRFGAGASGTVDTLREWCAAHGAELTDHALVEIAGAPVTSTRIRKLVSEGRVREAAELLGRPTRVAGEVHHGRAEGAALGFPTANIVPEPFAALPAEGVYAGRATLADGTEYAAAISIGLPPTFPEARDEVEAHLIDFDGDLYGQEITLEFFEMLRDQRAFGTTEALASAIAADVATTRAIAANHEPVTGAPFELNPAVDIGAKLLHSMGMDREPDPDFLEDGTPVVADPVALERATAEAGGMQLHGEFHDVGEEWVELVERRRLSGLFGEAGFTAALVTAPLQAAGIPFRWDPYSPEHMPGFRVGYGAIDRPFSLLVPKSRLEEARVLMNMHRVTTQTAPPTSDVLMPPRRPAAPAMPAAVEPLESDGEGGREPLHERSARSRPALPARARLDRADHDVHRLHEVDQVATTCSAAPRSTLRQREADGAARRRVWYTSSAYAHTPA